jgi:cyanuric acid amidohydrolase
VTRIADVWRSGMAAPDDFAAFDRALADGTLDPYAVKAVFAKTEGDGSAADTSRARFVAGFKSSLAHARGVTPQQIEAEVAILVSGGCEGVLSPHATVLTATAVNGPASPRKSLALGVAFTDALKPQDIGRMAQVEATRAAVAEALANAGIDDPGDVHFVQIKGPALSPAAIASAQASGVSLVTDAAPASIGLARAASALGVALSLGEIDPGLIDDTAIARRLDLYSTRASVSSAAEVPRNEVVVLGNASGWAGDLRIGHGVLADALDAAAIQGMLGALDKEIVAVFAKSAPDPRKTLRGHRHVMLDDPTYDGLRHVRAALGGLIAGLVGDPRVFLSGGAEHQGPLGGGLIAAISRRSV